MKGKWKATFNPAVMKYGVYRQRDITQIDHSGNREMHKSGYIFADRQTAEQMADDLNMMEEEQNDC